MTHLRDALKEQLSSNSVQTLDTDSPSATELSDRIKQLKAAHAVEPVQSRTERQSVAAEKPITVRIRTRQEPAHLANVSEAHDENESATMFGDLIRKAEKEKRHEVVGI